MPPSATPSLGAVEASDLIETPPVDLPTSNFTILCESWGKEAPPDEVSCQLAVRLAMTALGIERAGRTQRFEVRYGDGCVATVACERSAEVRTVAAISGGFETLLVRVARDASGEIAASSPVAGPMLPPAAFTPPPASAPSLGPGAPRELRGRLALPFCGAEVMSQPDDLDTAVRRCFLAGVRGWTAVEMTTTEPTEDGVQTRVYRYEGRGGIVDFVRTATGWGATSGAISPIDTPAVFVLTSPSESVELHP